MYRLEQAGSSINFFTLTMSNLRDKSSFNLTSHSFSCFTKLTKLIDKFWNNQFSLTEELQMIK